MGEQGKHTPLEAELLSALEEMVEEKCDYMRINHLGDPEQQHSIKRARAAISKATNPPR